MSVAKVISVVENDIHVSEMEPGDYGIITKNDSTNDIGKVVVCTYGYDIVGFNHPEKDTWDHTNKISRCVDFRVKLLPKGTKIEVVV